MRNKNNKPTAPGILRPVWLFWLAASLHATSGLPVGQAQSRTTPTRVNTARAITLVKTAETAFLRGDYKRTLVLCRQATAANPRYARAYTWLGAAYEKLGQTQQARQAYQRVLALGTSSQDAAYVRTRLSHLPAPPTITASARNAQRTAALPSATRNGIAQPTPARSVPETVPATQQGASSTAALPPPALRLPALPTPVSVPRPSPPVRPAPAVTSVPAPTEEPEIEPEIEPETDNERGNPVDVEISEADGGNSTVVIEVPGVVEPPHVVEAARLLRNGQMNALPRVRVQNRQWTTGIYRMSSQDQDLTFDLNGEWEWFEVRIAVADDSTTNTGGLWGWFNGQPSRRAFHNAKLQKGQAPYVLRVPVANATSLTLAPTYPGNPIILIEPRFIRRIR
jgi:hypothetical protein